MNHEQPIGHYNSSKQSSFYATYTSLCKDKNVPAILELIKSKNKLDFAADRIRPDQWDMICKSLAQDNALERLEIRSRKSENEPEKKLSILSSLIRAVSGCVIRNLVLTKLALEGLPLAIDYVQMISKAISRNSSLKSISFARSNILDEGCNVICCTIRDLPNIEKLNLSHCNLTATATDFISELIKFQMISRNSAGWMKSLRYREVDVDSVPGLKCLILNGNQLLDRGLEIITSRLKEDMWIKAIEVQNCDIGDVGGEAILDCLKFNKTLVVFDASHNYKISHKIHKKIQMTLNTEPDNYETMPKVTNSDLREKMEFLEQRLQLETFNRVRADDLNIQLHRNLVKCDQEVAEKMYQPPSGFKMIESGELNALYKEIEDLQLEKETLRQTVGDGKGVGEQSCFEEQSGFKEQSGIGDRSGLGDQSGLGEKSRYGEQSCFEEPSGFKEQSGIGDRSGLGDQSGLEEQSRYGEQSRFGEQFGFGDTLTSSEDKSYGSFNSFCPELREAPQDTTVRFTPYSQASSSDISSKFDDDVMTVNSEDVYCTDKKNSVFEEHIGYGQHKQQLFGDGKYQQVLDLFTTAK